MGYTPAFDTIYTGTLYGKWPTAAVWASLLPLIDAKGEINHSPEAIAGMTGWPLELLLEGLRALEQPDPRSRSKAEDGRRLVRLDPERDWGWRVVNVSLYRAKAAGLNQVADGRNAQKVRRYKERHRRTPGDTAGHQRHRETPETPHSDSYTDSDKEKNSVRASPPDPPDDPDSQKTAQSPTVDAAIFAEARQIFGSSIGGQLNKAIRAKGKPWVVELIERCRGKDPEAARAYLAAAMKGREEKPGRFRSA
jgi:hypothetical protein